MKKYYFVEAEICVTGGVTGDSKFIHTKTQQIIDINECDSPDADTIKKRLGEIEKAYREKLTYKFFYVNKILKINKL